MPKKTEKVEHEELFSNQLSVKSYNLKSLLTKIQYNMNIHIPQIFALELCRN